MPLSTLHSSTVSLEPIASALFVEARTAVISGLTQAKIAMLVEKYGCGQVMMQRNKWGFFLCSNIQSLRTSSLGLLSSITALDIEFAIGQVVMPYTMLCDHVELISKALAEAKARLTVNISFNDTYNAKATSPISIVSEAQEYERLVWQLHHAKKAKSFIPKG
jgi:hypothetical protein